MLKKLFAISVLLSVLTFASLAQASSIMYLDHVNGQYYGGYPVGPVYGTLDGAPTGFICDDFGHRINVPGTYQVTVSSLSDLSNTRFGNLPDGLFLYQQVAWLMWQMNSHPLAIGDLQYAIWNTFDASAPDTAGSIAWQLLAANIKPGDFDWSGVRIYTPVGKQEFIAAVPIPSAVWLLGSGLLGLLAFRRRRLSG